jgi:hypothetical protein
MCALMYEDVNGNGRRDTTDGMVVGGVFTIVDTQTGAPVQGYTTTSADANAHCFESLAPGAYTISSASPTGYNATTGTSFSQELRAGDTVNVEFGAQPSGTGGNTASASTGNSRLRTALFGAAGIVFLLLAAGVAGFLVLRRR